MSSLPDGIPLTRKQTVATPQSAILGNLQEHQWYVHLSRVAGADLGVIKAALKNLRADCAAQGVQLGLFFGPTLLKDLTNDIPDDFQPYPGYTSPDGTKTEQGVFFVHIGTERCFAAVAWWQPAPALLLAMRTAIAEKPKAFRSMVSRLEKNGLRIGAEGRLKRAPRGFEAVAEPDLAATVRNRHFVVRHEIDPAAIHHPALADELLDFALRAKPLLDWGRAIEAGTPAR